MGQATFKREVRIIHLYLSSTFNPIQNMSIAITEQDLRRHYTDKLLADDPSLIHFPATLAAKVEEIVRYILKGPEPEKTTDYKPVECT